MVPAPHAMTDHETVLLMYHPNDDALAPSIATVAPKKKRRAPKKKRRGKKKKQMVENIDNMADEPANELGPVVEFEFECTSQKRIEKVLELASSEAEDEGDEGVANDYNSYKLYPLPSNSTQWDDTKTGKDYWEEEQNLITTEHSGMHQSTQMEITAQYGHIKVRKALGRYNIIRQARNYQVDTGFMHRLWRHRKVVSATYNIKFGDQSLLDLAAVADLNRPIVIETDHVSV
jgi:hypothetical protein